ncbi:uncharacterized protein LOC127802812 isoform X2 [Diospyros lotus]|uniref:uncharacterized protein LOC127802812 isoform X2 n=1 Tax=Diospyros lotus TaxID=55363 RepID=UPI0022573A66|nr:uncharacterized protein LOC127802812 isoform X2 [Diospyros lotus]
MKKRKRPAVSGRRPATHPRNKYFDNPPDFGVLASLYPSFEPFVFYSRDGRPRIDWTDYNATRELTRVLLLHDHGLNWWIPDGQLCPTVPNRSNYIHWIEDLLSSDIISKGSVEDNGEFVRGFDIGTGANCIYPLLGASLRGWSFVGSDATDVALEWAERNVKNNPHISHLIEVRKVDNGEKIYVQGPRNEQSVNSGSSSDINEIEANKEDLSSSYSYTVHSGVSKSYCGPRILLGVVQEGEKFDFCMCNPPFFETMEEAGLNPKTSCGGTPEEMVCPGGEEAFICRIIQDSVELNQTFRWYTSMVGRKSNLKVLTSKLREVGVTIVKTTEFVQGKTCRWGLAWSFMPPVRKIISNHVTEKNAMSFTLEITVSSNDCDGILKNELRNMNDAAHGQYEQVTSIVSHPILPPHDMSFRISVFQQIPGTLLLRGSLQHRESPVAGVRFSLIFLKLEQVLKERFCREKAPTDRH